jgi:hypothetical protein
MNNRQAAKVAKKICRGAQRAPPQMNADCGKEIGIPDDFRSRFMFERVCSTSFLSLNPR